MMSESEPGHEDGWILPIALVLLTITSICAGTLFLLLQGNQVREHYAETSFIARDLAVSGVEYWIGRALEHAVQNGHVVGVGLGGVYSASVQVITMPSQLSIQSIGTTLDGAEAQIQVVFSLSKHQIVTWMQQP